MHTPLFSIISWVNNQELYQEMIDSFSGVDCEFIQIGPECTSMAEAYNTGTEKAKGKYLVYCHQDARLIDENFTSKVVKTITTNPSIGLIGVAGSSTNNQRGLWFAESRPNHLGGIKEDEERGWWSFGPTDCMARTIDALIMITDKRLMFPEVLPGIHFLDSWMCRQAEELGYYNWVCDIKMHHLSPGDVSTQEYRDNLAMYRWYWYHDQNARAHRSTLMPDLSIVVAVYNNLYHTSKLINQLKTEALGAEIIVVNNASSDGTHEWLNAQKDITVIENSKNEGVSRAWNLGLSKAKGKVLAVLNNDIDVIPGGIVKLYSAAVRCGISCASMIRSNENLIGGKKVNQVANSDYANGEALFFRRDVWLNVGEFDESYHMAYFEDVDWSCRARISGYTWFCVEDAINHVPGQTSKLIPDIHKHITTNKSIFEQRYQQMGYGNHIAFDFCSLSNIIDTMNQIQKSRSEQPLARIYVFCEPQYNVLFESKNIDYVGLKNESLDCNINIISDYYSMKSPLISANLISKEKRVLVSTLMCDRKKDSQMISLNAIEKLDYDSFDVYINIQSADPAEKFAEVYTWAQKQISKGTNVYIDTWEWKSDWSKTPAFDQDQARLVPICIARNMTLQAASCLQYDYLLQVDNDVIIPSDSIQRLIDEDSPIAGGVVPGRGCHSYAKYLSGHTIALENNRILVNCSTCGFLMLRRDVFEFMRYRTGSNLNGKHNLSEDPAFFEDALMVWGFGNPVILADLNADHWDNPNQPLTNNAAVNDTP